MVGDNYKDRVNRDTEGALFRRGRTQITLAVEGGGGFVKCLCYYISLCSKLANKGGRGVKNLQNPANVICVRPQTQNCCILLGGISFLERSRTLHI